jgi:hypothetical protein
MRDAYDFSLFGITICLLIQIVTPITLGRWMFSHQYCVVFLVGHGVHDNFGLPYVVTSQAPATI